LLIVLINYYTSPLVLKNTKKGDFMKYQLAILALLFVPANAKAQEEITAAEKEAMYQVMCVPKSKAIEDLSAEDKVDALNSQKQFINFLKSPEATVESLLQSPLFKDEEAGNPWDLLEPVITFAMTCGMTEILKSDIESRGCSDGQINVGALNALKLCQPLIEKLK